jgi:hypothetical protein
LSIKCFNSYQIKFFNIKFITVQYIRINHVKQLIELSNKPKNQSEDNKPEENQSEDNKPEENQLSVIAKYLQENLKIKQTTAVSIIGGSIQVDEYQKNHKKYDFFINHLLEFVRSSNTCLINGYCSKNEEKRKEKKTINLSQLIGQKLPDNPYYNLKNSKNNEKVRLIGIGSIYMKYESDVFSYKKDRYGNITAEFISSKTPDDILAIYNTDFIFADNERDVKELRLEFEKSFDYVTYVLINVNKKEQLEYINHVVKNDNFTDFKIVFVTVSSLFYLFEETYKYISIQHS